MHEKGPLSTVGGGCKPKNLAGPQVVFRHWNDGNCKTSSRLVNYIVDPRVTVVSRICHFYRVLGLSASSETSKMVSMAGEL